MLARLAVLFLALPALALAQDAPAPPGGRIAVVAQPPQQDAAPAAATPAPAILSPTPTAPPADPSECRMGCAQAYYFCRSGDHAEDCAPTWSQCVAACDSPALSDLAPPAPSD